MTETCRILTGYNTLKGTSSIQSQIIISSAPYLVADQQSHSAAVKSGSVMSECLVRNNKNWAGDSSSFLLHKLLCKNKHTQINIVWIVFSQSRNDISLHITNVSTFVGFEVTSLQCVNTSSIISTIDWNLYISILSDMM